MIKIKSSYINRLFVIISFFLITVSYSNYFQNRGLENIKMVGIAIIMYFILLKNLLDNTFNRRDIATLFNITILFLVFSLFQPIKVSGILLTIFYGVVLTSICIFGYKLINKPEDFFDIAIGCAFGIAFAIMVNVSDAFSKVGYGSRLRTYGGFAHPNTFAATSMIVIICLVYYISFTKSKRNYIMKVISLGIIAVMAYFIYLSNSRNSMIGSALFIALFITFAIFKRVKMNKAFKYGIVSAIIVVGAIYMLKNLNESAQDTLEGRVSSIIYIKDFNFIELLFGMGLTNNHATGSGSEFFLTTLIAKVGIFGLLIYVYLFVRFFVKGIKTDEKQLNYFLVTIITFMACCISESYITNITNTFAFIMWILISGFSNSNNELFVQNTFLEENSLEEINET